MHHRSVLVSILLAPLLVLAGQASAASESAAGAGKQQVPLYQGKPYLHVMHEGRSIKVQRVQDPDFQLRGYFAKTARKCPPFCLRPIAVDPRVSTVGEIEIFDFMERQLRDGNGLLIDARTPNWHQKGTIPGSVNIPFTDLTKKASDPAMIELLKSFGAKPRQPQGAFARQLEKWGMTDAKYKTEQWDFSAAKQLILWCNGPTCGQSPRAIKALLDAGYPAEKLNYYRGGMQLWQLFGLTTVLPTAE